MEKAVQDLIDKQSITEVIWRYCRGMDRMDRALTLSCWHPDGTDDHAPLFKGTAEGFVEWLWPVHEAMVATRHVVSNITIELNGDRAVTESYWNVQLRVPRADKTFDILGSGRYIDNFEKIDGVWAIRHRASIGDAISVFPIELDMMAFDPPLILPNNPEAEPINWARDKSDYSYEAFAKLTK